MYFGLLWFADVTFYTAPLKSHLNISVRLRSGLDTVIGSFFLFSHVIHCHWYAPLWTNHQLAKWKNNILSGETKKEFFGHKKRHFVWWTPDTAHRQKHVISTVKHGVGRIVLWGCFSTAAPARIVKEEAKMNAPKYREDNLIPSVRNPWRLRTCFPAKQGLKASSWSSTEMLWRHQGGCSRVNES